MLFKRKKFASLSWKAKTNRKLNCFNTGPRLCAYSLDTLILAFYESTWNPLSILGDVGLWSRAESIPCEVQVCMWNNNNNNKELFKTHCNHTVYLHLCVSNIWLSGSSSIRFLAVLLESDDNCGIEFLVSAVFRKPLWCPSITLKTAVRLGPSREWPWIPYGQNNFIPVIESKLSMINGWFFTPGNENPTKNVISRPFFCK